VAFSQQVNDTDRVTAAAEVNADVCG
jgi:hypothetical protein